MSSMHRLLARQIKRYSKGGAVVPPEFAPLFEAVSEAYEQADQAHLLVERSLALSSRELLDITRELSVAEKKFRSIFENATEGIFQSSPAGGFVAANPAMAKILGYDSPRELVAAVGDQSGGSYVDPERPAFIRRTLEEVGVLSQLESQVRRKDGAIIWISETVRVVRDEALTVLHYEGTAHEITERKSAEEMSRQLQSRLLETSRSAGMAEVATNVVHNIGNALNSINVSLDLVKARISGSKLSGLRKATDLFQQEGANLGTFLTEDPRGQRLPEYLIKLTTHLEQEQTGIAEELNGLAAGLDHVKRIVSTQLNYARVSGVKEVMSIAELVDSAVAMNRISDPRSGVKVVRDYEDFPPIPVDKHDVMQILVNLVTNAAHAMSDVAGQRKLTLRIRRSDIGGSSVLIQVEDTGMGIAPENMARIFNHGFTTKADGHGFGLHGAAIVANNMGGSLSAHSSGSDRGATFTLQIPAPAAAEQQKEVA